MLINIKSYALPLGDSPIIDGKRVSKNHHKPRFATLVKSLSPVYSLLFSVYFRSSEQRPLDKVLYLLSDRLPNSHRYCLSQKFEKETSDNSISYKSLIDIGFQYLDVVQ